MVSMRATSRRRRRSRLKSVSWPVTCWKRSFINSSRVSDSLVRICSRDNSRTSEDFMLFASFASHDPGFDRELVLSAAQRRHGNILGETTHLEHDASGLDHRHIIFDIALAGTHAGLRGLVGIGLGRENADPHLAAALHLMHNGAAGRFDLPGGYPAWLQRLQAILAEGDLRAAQSLALHTAAHLLAPLDTFWHQHNDNLLSERFRQLFADVHAFRRLSFFFNFRCNLAPVDPHLHADLAVGGGGFGLREIDVGTQSLKRYTSIAQPDVAGHVCTAQTASNHDLDPLGTLTHGLLDGTLHGAPVGDATFKLVGDSVGHQHGISIGCGDLLDVQLDLLADQGLKGSADA